MPVGTVDTSAEPIGTVQRQPPRVPQRPRVQGSEIFPVVNDARLQRRWAADAAPTAALVPSAIFRAPGAETVTDMAGASRSHLTTTPQLRLSASMNERIGVALYLKPANDREMTDHDKRYGTAFQEASVRLGAQIAKGELASFDELWKACRAWRLGQFDNPQERQVRPNISPDEKNELRLSFAYERNTQTTIENKLSWTPIAGKYGFITPKILASKNFTASVFDGHQVLGATHEVPIDGKRTELTRIFAFANELRESVPIPVNVLGVPLLGTIYHTSVDALPTIKGKISEQFEDLISADMTDPVERRTKLAEMHWLLAHAMLDHRGSAAKSELAIRSIAMALDMELPPFREDIAPDLEAFVRPIDDFVKKYQSDFFMDPENAERSA